MRRPTYSRSSFKPRSVRHSESKARNRLIITLVVIIGLIFIFFTWVLPFIIGHLSFLNSYKSKDSAEVVTIDEAIAPPVLFIPYEATNSASIPISGYATPLSKIEVYINDSLKAAINSDADGKFTTDQVGLEDGTNNIYAVTLNDAGKKSLPSKTIRLLYSNDKPILSVSEPADGTEIRGDKKVKVAGKTDPNDTVTINGSTAIVNSDGIFETFVPLNDGDNTLTIVAANSFGNNTQTTRLVKFIPQDASPSPSP